MIRADPEFKALIPPLSDEEYRQLEENCVRDGIRDALVVWPQGDGTDILLDGHNRWEISARHAGLRFDVKRMEFPDRESAKEWIIRNQFGRRNLSAYDRSLLALKLKPLIAERAKERQGTRSDICQISDKSSVDTKKELARIAGVSHDTIHKVEQLEREAAPEVKEQLKKGDISINRAYKETFHPAPEEEREERKPTRKQQIRELEEQTAEARRGMEGSSTVDFQELRRLRDDEARLAVLKDKDRWETFTRLDRELGYLAREPREELITTFRARGMEGIQLPQLPVSETLRGYLTTFTASTNTIKEILMEVVASEQDKEEQQRKSQGQKSH